MNRVHTGINVNRSPRHARFLNHRCPELIANRMAIRRYPPQNWWNLIEFVPDWDGDPWHYWVHCIVTVKFCPFCGKQLDFSPDIATEADIYSDKHNRRHKGQTALFD